MNLLPHIPHGAQDKTEYVRSLGLYRSDWYVFDGKVYSSNPVSIWNNTPWDEFCVAMRKLCGEDWKS